MVLIILKSEKGFYVKADRNVLKGKSSREWQKQTEKYINKRIRKGKDEEIITNNGEILIVSKTTAGKAKFRNKITQKDGRVLTISNKDLYIKLIAEVHIDELAKISIRINDKPVLDTKNHKFARDGFDYRKSYFEDFQGELYVITMSIGKSGGKNTIYNIGKLKKLSKKNRSKSSVYSSKAT